MESIALQFPPNIICLWNDAALRQETEWKLHNNERLTLKSSKRRNDCYERRSDQTHQVGRYENLQSFQEKTIQITDMASEQNNKARKSNCKDLKIYSGRHNE